MYSCEKSKIVASYKRDTEEVKRKNNELKIITLKRMLQK